MLYNVFNMSSNRKIKHIEKEIEKLEYYLKKSKNNKESIRDKALFYKLKLIALKSKSFFVNEIAKIVIDEEEHSVYKALEYLESIDFSNFIKSKKIDYYFVKALLYEIVSDYSKANEYYKKLTDIDETYKFEFNKFKERVELLRKNNKKEQLKDIDLKIKDIDILENKAKMLEKLSKNYSKSIGTMIHAKRYYVKVIDIYKRLYSLNKSRYYESYILSLIKAVEIYELDEKYLDEAEKIVFHSNHSPEIDKYFLNKIYQLKINRKK